MSVEISLRVARRLTTLDADLPNKVEYLLATRQVSHVRRQLTDPAIGLAVASLVVSCVGVAAQIVELLRKRADEHNRAAVAQRLEEIIERPQFLSEEHYSQIVLVVAEEASKAPSNTHEQQKRISQAPDREEPKQS